MSRSRAMPTPSFTPTPITWQPSIENTRDAIARIKAAGSEITAIKRLA